jgi:hypothetical protein
LSVGGGGGATTVIPSGSGAGGRSDKPQEKSWANVLAGEGWDGWTNVLPQSKKTYLPPPNEVLADRQYGFGVTGNNSTLAWIGQSIYGIGYGEVKGAETLRSQEKYESAPIYSERSAAEKQYLSDTKDLETSLSANKQYVSLNQTSGNYEISKDTPQGTAEALMKKFDVAKASGQTLDTINKRVETYNYNSPIETLKRETAASYGDQKPLSVFGIQPTVAWKSGVETIASPFIGPSGFLTSATSQKSTSIGGSIISGIMDVPAMTLQMVADAPLGAEMAVRDVANRGTPGFFTMAGYGQAGFGKYIIEDPIRAGTMLVTGAAISHVGGVAKGAVMEKSGLTRMSTYEIKGNEVVANAPATRTIGDMFTKDTIDVTHSSPSPVISGFKQIPREMVGDVAYGSPKPGVFGAPIVNAIGVAKKVLFEPTSEYFLNKPLLVPAIINTATAAYRFGDIALSRSGDYTPAIESAKRAASGYGNFIMKHTPGVGGSRVYLIENIETLAPEMKGTHAGMATEMQRQFQTRGFVEAGLYDSYAKLAYEKSAAAGGKPIAIIAPKKASGYHMDTKNPMGAPFESEVYIVSAEYKNGVAVPLKELTISSRQFKGYSYGPSGARVVEVGLKGQSTQPKPMSIGETLKENRAYNMDTSKTPYLPYDTLWKMNVGGSTIQRGWYEAMKQDMILKAQEMHNEPGYWAPKEYYGSHGLEHSMSVTQNIRSINANSPETINRMGGSAPADRFANAAGLGHDIAKIGDVETQPYTHAFVAAEALRTGEMKAGMGTQTYNKIFGGMSQVELMQTSKAISEHTQVQPMRSPGAREIINWKTKTGAPGEKGHFSDFFEGTKAVASPIRGTISRVLWNPDIQGKTLATADRMDIGRVGKNVQPSKLFRTPEEQRAANMVTLQRGLVIGGAIASAKMGLPPIVAGGWVMAELTPTGGLLRISVHYHYLNYLGEDIQNPLVVYLNIIQTTT